METELYKQIEAYLNGALPEQERKAFEDRMASDEALRQEVALHRELQESYEDPARWKFRQTLQEIMKAPLAPDDPDQEPSQRDPVPTFSNTFQSGRLILALILILLLGMGIWYWVRQSDQSVESPQAPAPVQLPAPDNPTELPTQTDPQTPPPPLPQQPIAKADPANFRENRTMEGLIAMRDGGDLNIQMTRPVPAEKITWNPSGKTTVLFSGSASGLATDAEQSLTLMVFGNQDAQTPIFSRRLVLRANARGEVAFSRTEQVRWAQGLYYFRLETEEGEVVEAGKFLIGGE